MPAVTVTIRGLEKWRGDFKYHVRLVGERVGDAMLVGGEYLLTESHYIVPVDTGHMRDTSYVRREGTGFYTVIIVAYTAEYAVYVHEDLGKAHGDQYNIKYASQIAAGLDHPRRPQEQAKFLEEPLRTKRGQIAAIIRRMAQI